MTPLGSRARKILYAVITEYISTGEPVGSRTIARRYGVDLSPASIRNVLADLEEGGFLAQPHTSAGRVPTDRGFRAFVDALMQVREVAPVDREAIVARMKSLRPGVDDVMREAGRLLSSLTGAAAVVLPLRAEHEVVAQLRFVRLRQGELLAVIVSRSGSVQNSVVRIAHEVAPAELDRIHNYLDELLVGRTLAEARDSLSDEMENDRGKYDQLRRRVMEFLDATMSPHDVRAEVVVEGQGLLFDRPEFADVEKIRGLIRAFEEKERLLELLDRTLDARGVQVFIGAEANLGDKSDLSVVSANYRPGTASAAGGTVGVIGPTRMDYGKVVPLVGFTAQVISDLLDGGATDDDETDRERDSDGPKG